MPKSLTSIADALSLLLASAQPKFQTERVELGSTLGRILAHDISATMAVPAFDNSAMDGFAVNHLDCVHTDTLLKVSQYIKAGHPASALQPGTAARIFTGASLPAGATAVVMQENTRTSGEVEVCILQVPQSGENVRRAGHDIAAGSLVLGKGHQLQAQDLGLLASLGLTTLEVYQPLTVALLNTGDELKQQGQALLPGELYDSNSFTLAAGLQQLGMKVIKAGIVGDDLQATKLALQQTMQQADCVITTGGVSVGEADYVREAVQALGEIKLWKLAIKPGKPFSFGKIGQVPFFGLPGNPVAVFITFAILVKPYLLKMQGAHQRVQPALRVRAGFAVNEAGSRQEYLRVRLQQGANGQPIAHLFADQSSSVLTSLSWADGLAIVPVNTEVQPGQELDYLPFRGLL
jgi:molybdopterin molybdotransferase